MSKDPLGFEARVEKSILDSRHAAERARATQKEARRQQLQKQIGEQQKQQQTQLEAKNGLSTADIFSGPEVEVCRDFLAYMAKNTYRRATILSDKKLQYTPGRSIFGFEVKPEHWRASGFSVRGYPLQMYTGEKYQTLRDVAFLCEDERIRFADVNGSFPGGAILKTIAPAAHDSKPTIGFHLEVQDGWTTQEVTETYTHGPYSVQVPTYRHDFHRTELDTYLTRLAVLAQ